MMDDMGIFRTAIEVAHVARSDHRHALADVVVDTGTEYTWIPRHVLVALGVQPERTDQFQTADGRVLDRDVGFACVFAAGRLAVTVVVFAEPNDLLLLGAHALAGLNVQVDLGKQELVPGGPIPAAAA